MAGETRSRGKAPQVQEHSSPQGTRRLGPAASPNALESVNLMQTAGNQALQRLLRAGVIQPKLTVSQPGDAHEQEADRLARQVVSAVPGDMVHPRTKGEGLQTRGGSSQTPAINTKTASQLASLSGGGCPLPPSIRAFFEPKFGQDFSQVRVHTDNEAIQTARTLGAQAFTTGKDVYFGSGRYQPLTKEGQELLAHELVHIIQQRPDHKLAESIQDGKNPRLPFPAKVSRAPTGTLQRRPHGRSASSMISEYTSWGSLDERGLGRRLFELAWMSPAHYGFVIQVIDALNFWNRDDVSLHFGLAARDENLDEFASTEEGRRMLRRLESELLGGPTFPQEESQALRFRQALARYEAAQTGLERGRGILEAAARAVPVSPAAPGVVQTLGLGELSNRLRLVETLLNRLAERYPDDTDIAAAVVRARGQIQATRAGLSVNSAPEMSRRIPEAQVIVERIEGVLLNLDLQIPSFSREGFGTSAQPFVNLTQIVRGYYIQALGAILTREAVTSFNRAERVAERLPRSLTEIDLAALAGRAPTYSLLESSRREIAAWVERLRAELDAFETEAAALREARATRAANLGNREVRLRASGERLQLSLEALKHWERVLRGFDFLASGGNVKVSGYLDVTTIVGRCRAMRDAAMAGDLETLRQRVTRHREDPVVERFYRGLPGMVRYSQFVISLGVALVAAMATAGVGGLVELGIGATATTTGAVLAFSGTAAVEALTFTLVSRGMAEALPGTALQSSFLADLAWNFGLFAALRGLSGGIRTALAARSLQILERPVSWIASAGFLQGYGMLRFRLEEGRWPSADELNQMTAQNLIMLVGLSLGTGAVRRLISGGARWRALQTFEQRYASRFEAFGNGRQQLINDFRTALEQGRGAEAAVAQGFRNRAERLQQDLRTLVEEVKADRTISLEQLRAEFQSLTRAALEASEELLARSLGMPEEAGLRRSGGLEQYTYAWGKTTRLQERLRALNAMIDSQFDQVTGLHTLTANFPNRPPMTFVERASAFPAGIEVEVDLSSPLLNRLLSDFAINDSAAQRFVVHLVEVELAKNPTHGMGSAIRPVRRWIRSLEQTARANGRTTETELLIRRSTGRLASEARAELVRAANSLVSRDILSSTEWLLARTPSEFKGVVAEWLAFTEAAGRAGTSRIVLRQIHMVGDLFMDAAASRPRLDPSTGRPQIGVDVVPELDLLTISEAGGRFEFYVLSNVKGFAGGVADAAAQNRSTLEALRAHQRGEIVGVVTRQGERVFARITEVSATDPRTRSPIDLTGRLQEVAGGAVTETIGPRGARSRYERLLPVSERDLETIAEILRERQSMRSPEY